MHDYDAVLKLLFQQSAQGGFEWLRRADLLARVSDVLFHLEFQSRNDRTMPLPEVRHQDRLLTRAAQ